MSSSFTYNGITLNVIELLDFHREPVYDGPTHIFTHWRIRVRTVYNPAINSYKDLGGVLRPRFSGGTNERNDQAPNAPKAPETDVAIRHWLEQPQRTFVWTIGGKELVRAPAEGYQVDANLGPKVLVGDIVKITGQRSFTVEFAIEFWLNEYNRSLDFANLPVVVSHRWQRSHDIDQDFYTTITTEGHAILRADRLKALAAVPDDFRDQLFHPVPRGFRRVQVGVRASEDGNRLQYRTVDREMSFQFAESVSRIEAKLTISAGSLSVEAMGRRVASVSGWASFGSFLASGLPRTTITAFAGVWGQNYVPRNELMRVGLLIVTTKIESALNLFQNRWGSTHLEVSHDLTGRYVEVVARRTTTIPGKSGILGQAGFPTIWKYFDPAKENELAGTITDARNLPGRGLPAGKGPIGQGCRGSYIESLAAQVLQNPGERSGPPPAPRVAAATATL